MECLLFLYFYLSFVLKINQDLFFFRWWAVPVPVGVSMCQIVNIRNLMKYSLIDVCTPDVVLSSWPERTCPAREVR